MSSPEAPTHDFKQFGLLVGGALALAAHFFPRRTNDGPSYVELADARFFLTGQVHAWSRWPELDQVDQVRVARLLRHRPVEAANLNVFGDLIRMLLPEHLPGFRAGTGETVLVDLGLPPLAYVDECLAGLEAARRLRDRKPRRLAISGEYVSVLPVPAPGMRETRAVQTRYRLVLDDVPAPPEPIDVGSPADAESIAIPVDDLAEIAARLDAAFGERHRGDCVDRLFGRLRSVDGDRIDGQWVLRAGPTRIFNAPTGVGKNVLAELVACWCARRGMVASVVLPTNGLVMSVAHLIEQCLRELGVDALVTPLVSPDSAQQVAETAMRGADADDPHARWVVERAAYGCALPATAVIDEAVDAWQPGAEPCDGLRRSGSDGRVSRARYTCPWRPSCGKYRMARAACAATVIVTSHMNFLVGAIHVPVRISGRVEENLRVEELLLHRSHLVLVDEIDVFQAATISHSARGLVLADRVARAIPPPLRRLDEELSNASGRLDRSVEAHLRAATFQARYLAESYTGHLADGAFTPGSRGGRPARRTPRSWLLPRKWDGWLAATLFCIDDDVQPGNEHYAALHSLFPDEGDPAETPGWLLPVRTALAMATSLTTGEDSFDTAWTVVYAALGDSPYIGSPSTNRLADAEARALATDRLLRRAYLERLRRLLLRFVYAAPSLQASGVGSAREIADALGQYAAWRAAPYGPMGRVLFAFTEHYDPTRPADTSLRVTAFGGDPHTYVATLGELTALAHTGQSRVIVGLSATAFFPGDPHHHVYARPTWWVPDDHTGGVVVHASPVSDEEREFVRISGRHGRARRQALTKLGALLWRKRLHPEIQRLAAETDTGHRAHVLVATTSYQGARNLAEGISDAGVPPDKIALAVRPDDHGGGGPRRTPRWVELPADRLEAFGREVDAWVLIAPLARAERGLNIVDATGRSLIGSVWLVVRPVPLLDEPAELLAHVNSRAHAEATPTDTPAAVLDLLRRTAAKHYDELFSTLPYFRSLPPETQLAIAAQTLVGLIQLAGRARRGGDIGEIHLVDYAFLDVSGKSDLPRLIRALRRHWRDNGDLELIEALYGDTIAAVFTFADNREDA